MSSNFWLIATESRDLSQAEEEIIVSRANLLNDNYFHCNENLGPL